MSSRLERLGAAWRQARGKTPAPTLGFVLPTLGGLSLAASTQFRWAYRHGDYRDIHLRLAIALPVGALLMIGAWLVTGWLLGRHERRRGAEVLSWRRAYLLASVPYALVLLPSFAWWSGELFGWLGFASAVLFVAAHATFFPDDIRSHGRAVARSLASLRQPIERIGSRALPAASTVLAGLTAALIVSAAGAILYSAFSALTHGKFQLFDYGLYTNMIWNTAHGRPFRLLVDESYLARHLSFTLVLLAPFFWIWDHPFLLSVLQWSMAVGGLVIWHRAARRHALPAALTCAFLFFWMANPFMQTVLLSEFHGVGAYLILIPWLYYCLVFHKSLAWLPLVLLWGVREDAAFIAVPILLYVAVYHRWRLGYLLAVASLVYGALACSLLFEWMAGMPLSQRRPLSSFRIVGSLATQPAGDRLWPLFLMYLPALGVVRRGWVPLAVLPSAALAITLLSPLPAQHAMRLHYSAPVLACVAIALFEALARRARPRHGLVAALFLIATTLAAHHERGFLPGGPGFVEPYRGPHLAGVAALRMASHIAPDGVLLTDMTLGGIAANRYDLTIWEKYRRGLGEPQWVFFRLGDLRRGHGDTLTDFLRAGAFGVWGFDGEHVVLRRGHDLGRNADVLRALREAPRTIRFALTPRVRDVGDVLVEGAYIARYWPGGSRARPAVISPGVELHLEAGPQRVRFWFRAEPRGPGGMDHWGWLGIYVAGQPAPLAEIPIEPVTTPPGVFRYQTLLFELREAQDVEPRVTAASAALWLDRAVFLGAGPDPDGEP